MRRTFAEELYKQMEQNESIWLLCLDLGYGWFDKIRDDFPNRFLNPGAAEQAGMDIAVGLSLEGKTPFVYSITPFLIDRPFETLRTYVNHEKLNVKLIASGRDKEYTHDGISHHSEDVKPILDTLPNIHQIWPEDKGDIIFQVKHMIDCIAPDFISLKR